MLLNGSYYRAEILRVEPSTLWIEEGLGEGGPEDGQVLLAVLLRRGIRAHGRQHHAEHNQRLWR